MIESRSWRLRGKSGVGKVIGTVERLVGRKSRRAEGVAICEGCFVPDLSRAGRELATMGLNTKRRILGDYS